MCPPVSHPRFRRRGGKLWSLVLSNDESHCSCRHVGRIMRGPFSCSCSPERRALQYENGRASQHLWPRSTSHPSRQVAMK
uniref:Uncharacterized protein n=1 Tax=Aegilops tauschii subsp. strangulata TaxID=200361 RepID=A0A453KTB7_AEGTS